MKYLTYILAFALTGALFAGGPARRYASGSDDDQKFMDINYDDSSPDDTTPNANDGEFNDEPTYTSAGVVGGGLAFDGIDDDVTFASDFNAGWHLAEFTVASWFNNTEASAADNHIHSDYGTSQSALLLFGLTTAHQVRFFVRDSGLDVASATTTATFNDSKWHFAVGVRIGTNVFLYIDGQLDATGSNATLDEPVVDVTPVPRIASLSDFSDSGPFQGTLDENRLWGRALSATEILQLYHQEQP